MQVSRASSTDSISMPPKSQLTTTAQWCKKANTAFPLICPWMGAMVMAVAVTHSFHPRMDGKIVAAAVTHPFHRDGNRGDSLEGLPSIPSVDGKRGSGFRRHPLECMLLLLGISKAAPPPPQISATSGRGSEWPFKNGHLSLNSNQRLEFNSNL